MAPILRYLTEFVYNVVIKVHVRYFIFCPVCYKRSPQNGSPYAIGPLSVLSVRDVGLLWPNGWVE